MQEAILYSEKLRRVLFLGSLPAGEYTVSISNGQEDQFQPIQIKKGSKVVHPDNGKTLTVGFSKPSQLNSIDVIVQNKLKSNVSVKVYDKSNRLIQQEELGQDVLLKRVLKFEKAEKGEITIRVGTKENTFVYKCVL